MIIRHLMVVIDPEKHKLNFKQSEIDNNDELAAAVRHSIEKLEEHVMCHDYDIFYNDTTVRRMVAQMNEQAYQQEHKKVKDRYSSPKFYLNNFKRNRKWK